MALDAWRRYLSKRRGPADVGSRKLRSALDRGAPSPQLPLSDVAARRFHTGRVSEAARRDVPILGHTFRWRSIDEE